jgi:hypothetical protein
MTRFCSGFLWGVGWMSFVLVSAIVTSIVVAQKGIYPQ